MQPDAAFASTRLAGICHCTISRLPRKNAFGAPGCIRLSYAISDDRLAQALDRIEGALA